MQIKVYAIVSLFCLWASAPVHAASIDLENAAAALDSRGLSAEDKRFITAPLFEFSPFSANNQTVVPGFADPLGTGIDPGLKIFSGKVHYMDLLGNFDVAKANDTDEIELPAGALQGINPLDNFLSLYLSYNGRAYDSALLDLDSAEVTERNGLPVTRETSPLSLAGYGSVSENLRPVSLHWTRCPGKDKREHSMAEAMQRFRPPCSVPGVCTCYVI